MDTENWVNVPTNSILTIHRQTVMVHPILDKYYERDPHHVRSSAFVQAKGLVSNEKPQTGSMSPAIDTSGSTNSGFDNPGKLLGHQAISRSISPDFVRRSLTPACARESRLHTASPSRS